VVAVVTIQKHDQFGFAILLRQPFHFRQCGQARTAIARLRFEDNFRPAIPCDGLCAISGTIVSNDHASDLREIAEYQRQ